jgi:hypothetical protein
MTANQPTHGFIDTMSRVMTDAAFRDQLLDDPDGTLAALGLAPSDRDYIAKIARDQPHLIRAAAEDRTGMIVATWAAGHVKDCP